MPFSDWSDITVYRLKQTLLLKMSNYTYESPSLFLVKATLLEYGSKIHPQGRYQFRVLYLPVTCHTSVGDRPVKRYSVRKGTHYADLLRDLTLLFNIKEEDIALVHFFDPKSKLI